MHLKVTGVVIQAKLLVNTANPGRQLAAFRCSHPGGCSPGRPLGCMACWHGTSRYAMAAEGAVAEARKPSPSSEPPNLRGVSSLVSRRQQEGLFRIPEEASELLVW